MNATNKNVTYKAKGLVYGQCWGGGEAAYCARKLEDTTIGGIRKQANVGIKNGSLDSGMGFERLLSAMLEITKVTTVEIDGKEFVNEETETEFFGVVTEDVTDFLLENSYSY